MQIPVLTQAHDIRIATGETWEYNYNHENRLVGVTKRDASSGPAVLKVWFKYDVQGNRIEKTVDPDGDGPQPAATEKFTYTEDGNAWADLDASGNITTRRMYLDAVDALFARIGSGDPEWYLTDHLGTVRQIADSSGAILDEITYDGFGAILSESSPTTGDRYKYTAREWDAETQLQYNRARYYDPATRRWISQDPLGFDAGDGNLYRYVKNEPTHRVDSNGAISFHIRRPGVHDLEPSVTMTVTVAFRFVYWRDRNWTEPRRRAFRTQFERQVERIWAGAYSRMKIYIGSTKDEATYYRIIPGVSSVPSPVYSKELKREMRRWRLRVDIVVEDRFAHADYVINVKSNPFGRIHRSRADLNPAPGTRRDVAWLDEADVWGDGRVAAHEFGHLIGANHPGADLPAWARPPANEDEDYLVDRNALMGAGTDLRPQYFVRWAKALNDFFPTKRPYVPMMIY